VFLFLFLFLLEFFLQKKIWEEERQRKTAGAAHYLLDFGAERHGVHKLCLCALVPPS